MLKDGLGVRESSTSSNSITATVPIHPFARNTHIPHVALTFYGAPKPGVVFRLPYYGFRCLVQAGADKDKADLNGFTPLHLSFQSSQWHAVLFMVDGSVHCKSCRNIKLIIRPLFFKLSSIAGYFDNDGQSSLGTPRWAGVMLRRLASSSMLVRTKMLQTWLELLPCWLRRRSQAVNVNTCLSSSIQNRGETRPMGTAKKRVVCNRPRRFS